MACKCNCSHSQGTTNPLEALKDEHRVIERVLDAAERVIQEPRIDKDFITKMIDFVRNFADGCHHAKEEEQLFPVLEDAGLPREGGPIGCMLHEHEAGRLYIRSIADNLEAATEGNAAAAIAVRNAIGEYIDLLRQHIAKEDNVLFEMADQILGVYDLTELGKAFDRVEETHGERHQKYLDLADELYNRAFAAAEPSRK